MADSEVTFPEQVLNAVIEHVARYKLTVAPVLSRLPCFEEARSRDIRTVLKVLCNASLLASAPLCLGQRYWHLTAAGAQHAGISHIRCGPLAEAAKIRAYAMLRYCWLHERPRHLLAATEVARHFPELGRPGLPAGFFFDSHGEGRLGLLRVDAGHRGRWDRIVESLREDISSHVNHAGFRRLIHAGRFEIVLVIALPQKARRIRDALVPHHDALRIPVQVVSLPELLPLITSIPRKEMPRTKV